MIEPDRVILRFKLAVLIACMGAYLALVFAVKKNVETGMYGDAAFYFMIAQLFLFTGMQNK